MFIRDVDHEINVLYQDYIDIDQLMSLNGSSLYADEGIIY